MDRQRSLSDEVLGSVAIAGSIYEPVAATPTKAPSAWRNGIGKARSRIWMKLTSNPFVKSAVEEVHPGTLKRTRENTQRNRKLSLTANEKSVHSTTETHSSLSSLSVRSVTPKRVAFHGTVKEFSHKEDAVGEHAIRFIPRQPPSPRTYRRSWPSAHDVRLPQSSAGKWLMGHAHSP